MSTLVTYNLLFLYSSLWSNGNTNAAVLPEPVIADISTSLPLVIVGIDLIWISDGYSYPNTLHAFINGFAMFNSLNVFDELLTFDL